MPQSSGRDASALSQSLQLRPGNGDRDFAIAGGRLKAAIVTEDHVLTAGDTGPALDAVGNCLGVLDHHIRMRDGAGDQQLSVGQFDALQHPPLVLVPRVGGLERIGPGRDRKDQVEDVFELQIADARSEVDPIACMKADTIFRQPARD